MSESYLDRLGAAAREASETAARLATGRKNGILLKCADALTENAGAILEANEKDMAAAASAGIKPSFLDRLKLDKKRIGGMADGLRQVAGLPDPVGEAVSMKTLPNGLVVQNVRIPMGVIGMIYEARPNVTSDAFGLCFKAGSAVILRGGKEALASNRAIVSVFHGVLGECGLPVGIVQLIEDASRETARDFMRLNRYVDLLIPRGGAGLIQSVVENSSVPVIETGVGNCHIFVDESADFAGAVDIIVNAKVQRPSVCNAVEKVLVHKAVAEEFLPLVGKALAAHTVEIRGDEWVTRLVPGAVTAVEEDWPKEYGELIIAMRAVDGLEEAIAHIRKYSSHHSEAILSNDYANIMRFTREIDSAAVYANASTRFTDGGEFGMGAEIGISTRKLPGLGPMGLREITSTKYVIFGSGQVRG
ncbi:MAG: glutamate-5-semialdehyde dehydrogenase [Firmicutes bacterium]|nr:glutamate-5-semialdehyde dehydrogenase [Bacillota bacterium]